MKPSLRDVTSVVCARFSMTPDMLKGPDRSRRFARPRQIAMYLARELTGKSYPAIGAYFCRDHSTVMYAQRRIGALIARNPKVAAHVEGLRAAMLQRDAA